MNLKRGKCRLLLGQRKGPRESKKRDMFSGGGTVKKETKTALSRGSSQQNKEKIYITRRKGAESRVEKVGTSELKVAFATIGEERPREGDLNEHGKGKEEKGADCPKQKVRGWED